MTLLKTYESQIIIELGAHIHHIEVMAPVSKTVTGLNAVQVILPAISPVYGNNPGYGVLEIDDSTWKVRDLSFSFFQLEDYYRMGVTMWRDLDLQQ